MLGILKLQILWICTLFCVTYGFNGDDKYTPKEFCVRLITNNSILLQWLGPIRLRSQIQGYTVYYTNDVTNFTEYWNSVTIGMYPMTVLRNIHLGEQYYFRIRVNPLGLDGSGPLSDVFSFKLINRTKSCYDLSMRALHVFRATATSYSSIEVWWNLPYDPHHVKGFMVSYGTSEMGIWLNKTTNIANSLELTNLTGSNFYIIVIAAITDKGLEYYPNEIRVNISPEEIPMEVKATDVTADSILLKWLPPLRLQPRKYKIVYNGIKNYVDSFGIRQHLWLDKNEEVIDGHQTSFELVDLSPYTQYFINISAVPVDHSYLPSVKITAKTDVGPPVPMQPPTINGVVSGSNIQIYLPKASEENGPISYYYVIVVPEHDQDDLPTDVYTTEDLLENNWLDDEEIDAPYIAAKFTSQIPFAFILGTGVVGGFKNYPLYKNKSYRVFVRAVVVTSQGHFQSDSSYSEYFSIGEEKKKYSFNN